ncbi:hypothetical protein N8I77_006449 [Diaporthe amygdali]|uniref:Uncharacterized protein n=1 Tax=Phomopsis amygdali TaxID=1214568 RepID=A0AAD9SFY4_PHOAM|nr:hypothetical protein N8I77_006449 [Diaporthe amygdali]
MSDPTQSPETPKKGAQLSEKQVKLLATMTQNTIGKVEYNWEKIAAESGYKNVASAKTTFSRLCTQMNGGGSSKSPADKGGAPVAGGPNTPTKVTKRTGKVGSASAKKPRGKKNAPVVDVGEEDTEKSEQVNVKDEKAEAGDEVDAMMSGAL